MRWAQADLFDLTDKVAMVTGSTRGLAETSVRVLAKTGAEVAICGPNPVASKRRRLKFS